jgi:hypothetical protein
MEISTSVEISHLRVGVHLHLIKGDVGVGDVWRLDVYFAFESDRLKGENKWIPKLLL